MREMQVKVDRIDNHTLRIDSRHMINDCANSESVRKMRASYYLLGVLLGRFKNARVAFPGGCDFGVRPIDLHVKGFEALGAEVNAKAIIEMKARELVGTNIFLDIASVGATINIMLAAVLAKGSLFALPIAAMLTLRQKEQRLSIPRTQEKQRESPTKTKRLRSFTLNTSAKSADIRLTSFSIPTTPLVKSTTDKTNNKAKKHRVYRCFLF